MSKMAIAYGMKKKKKMADGGEVMKSKKKSLSESASDFFGKMSSPQEAPQSQDDKYAAIREKNKKEMGYAHGGAVSPRVTPSRDLMNLDSDEDIQTLEEFELYPTQFNKAHVAQNGPARAEDNKRLGQMPVDMHASTSQHEQDLVDRIMNKKSKSFSSLQRLAHGGPVDASGGNGPYENDEQDMVDRIMYKIHGGNEDFAQLDRYSKGGQIANDVGTGQEADKLPNQHDDLVLRDELESSYGDYDNAGDDRGNDQEDEDRKDIVARIMASRRKKDRMPPGYPGK